MLDPNSQTLLDVHVKRHADAYSSGLLKPEFHYRLVEDLDKVCAVSGVRREFVLTSSTDFCGPLEREWVRNIRHNSDAGVSGLLYVSEANVERRMMALAGVCLRNYIHARVMTLNSVLEEVAAGNHNQPTVLFVLNFQAHQGKHSISKWDASTVYDVLLSRYTQKLQTVVSVSTLSDVEVLYGAAAMTHLEDHYQQV